METLLRIVESLLGWHRHQLSRAFTIRKRTYQVCLECGQEFEYSWALMHPIPSSVATRPYAPLDSARHADASAI
jgi:hypothetical protein